MNKKFYSILLTVMIAVVLSITFVTETVDAEQPLKDGIYFVGKNNSQGEFYSFQAWVSLTPIKKANLVINYPKENIKPLLAEIGFIATLKDIEDSRKPFLSVSKAYKDGDLPGDYKDYETGKIISIGVTPTNFEVIEIY